MNKQEYLQEIQDDAEFWLDEYFDNGYYEDGNKFDSVWDDIQLEVTGNDNGSYYCNTRKAEQAISGVVFDDDINSRCKDLGYNGLPTEEGAETCDVIVRIVLLDELYSQIKSYWDDKVSEWEEEHEDE